VFGVSGELDEVVYVVAGNLLLQNLKRHFSRNLFISNLCIVKERVWDRDRSRESWDVVFTRTDRCGKASAVQHRSQDEFASCGVISTGCNSRMFFNDSEGFKPRRFELGNFLGWITTFLQQNKVSFLEFTKRTGSVGMLFIFRLSRESFRAPRRCVFSPRKPVGRDPELDSKNDGVDEQEVFQS
jgi:hypothetical protein